MAVDSSTLADYPSRKAATRSLVGSAAYVSCVANGMTEQSGSSPEAQPKAVALAWVPASTCLLRDCVRLRTMHPCEKLTNAAKRF